jgi:ribosomal protein S18 acetylase RimI-like enzyme
MATAVAYVTSVYGFNFAVNPKFRRMGLGRRIMHEAQRYALSLGLHQISATVDASKPRLLNYYINLGASVVTPGESVQQPYSLQR